MSNQAIHDPLDFSPSLRLLEIIDLAHPDTFNPLFERLINNDAFMSAFTLALAGVGWTNQTVKGVSDAQAAHVGAADPHTQYALDADLDTHKAETATETVKGHVELATAAETTAGTDSTRAVHPVGLKVELDKKLALALLTTQGDIPYATAAGIWARLAKGTVYQALGMNSGATAPQYMASLQSLITAAGDIIYGSAANTPAKLAKGADGQVLVLASGLPTWGSAGAKVVSGSYIGSGAPVQSVSVGFAPKFVFVVKYGDNFISFAMCNNTLPGFRLVNNAAVEVQLYGTNSGIPDLHSNGFNVYTTGMNILNYGTAIYYYVAVG